MGWVKGQSGNPNGRPTSKAVTIAKALLNENAHELMSKCIELALSGDASCMKLCIERIIPNRHELDLPEGISVSLNMVLHEKS